jgi:hypothetical protein|tara:strand:- start:1155 stop:1538 length:384 start_codon:yes stop_codon:yes gene_type:complete
MIHFAQIGLNNKIIAVNCVDDSVILDAEGIEREDLGVDFLANLTGWHIWKRTWTDGSQRYNYAGKGFTWDEDAEAFIPPKIYDNFILDTKTYRWVPPIPYPTDGEHYVWDDKTNQWVDAQIIGNDYS